MFSPDKLKRSVQLFRNHKCCIEHEQIDDTEMAIDDDVENNMSINKVVILDSLSEMEMKNHIIKCIEALTNIQNEKKEMKKNNIEYNVDQIVADNKIFIAAVTISAQQLNNGKDKTNGITLTYMLNRYIDISNIGWNPLAWGIALGNRVDAEDIKIVYAADTMALGKPHVQLDIGSSDYYSETTSYSPAHMICMQTNPPMSLIRFLIGHNSQAFNATCTYSDFPEYYNDDDLQYGLFPLHLAAKHSESVELLQILLQLDVSIANKKSSHDKVLGSPLSILCKRKYFPAFMDMVHCLIKVDKTVEVIENSIEYCLESHHSNYKSIEASSSITPVSVGHKTLTLIDTLLKANPEAAKCENEALMHNLCQYTQGDLWKSLISLFFAANKDIFKLNNDIRGLPAHSTARSNSLEALKHLLEMYPESALMVDSQGNNILHYAMKSTSIDISMVKEKVKFINREYPNLFHESNIRGYTPLHSALSEVNLKGAIALYQADVTVVKDRVIYSNITSSRHLFLPLHILISEHNADYVLPLSNLANHMRLLIKLYPEAAGIKDGAGLTPYDLAVDQEFSPYFQRLLLQADPTINPNELHRLNYNERRLAMFLAFRAVVAVPKLTIWGQLRMADKNLLRHVISFL